VQKMRSDAQAHANAEPCDGFTGDPLHPVGGAYFGHLAWVSVAGGDAGGLSQCQPLAYSYSGSVYGGTGHVSRLYEDDSSRLELSSAYSGGSYVTELRPTTKIAPSQQASLKKLTVVYDGHLNTSSASQTVRVWNFATGAWQTVSGPTTGITSDRRITWSNSTSPKSYVSPSGEIRLSVLGRRSGGSFRARTDLVRFTVES
jgi:hypothetical protein